MATRGKLISDIELRLTKSKPSDDLELERAQIAHWIDIVRDEVVSEYLYELNKKGEIISADYITKEACIAFTSETDSCVEENRRFITLAGRVLNLSDDKGIIRVYTDDSEVVYPTTLEHLQMIIDMPFTSPNKDMYVYHREGPSKLVITGLNDNPVTAPKFTVYYIQKTEGSSILDTDEYPIGSELIPMVLDRVEDIGRRELYNSVEDLENDGEQDLDG